MKQFIISILFLLISAHYSLFGQVTADFAFPTDNPCLLQNVNLENLSTNATSYKWDFCPGDFNEIPVVSNNLSSAINLGNSFKLIEHNGNYYGFALNAGLLYRYEFGNNLSNTPTLSNLGDLGVLNNAEGLDIAKEGDKWIGFTGFGFGANGGNVFRLVWEDLSLPPVGENLGNFGQAGRVRAIGIASDQTQKALIMVYGNNTLSRVDFGSSLLNSFGSGDIYVSAALTDVSGAIGLSTIKKGADWYVAIASINNRGLSVFSLGTNLFSAPQYITSTLFPSYGTFAKLKLVEEAGNFYGLLSINNVSMKLMDFKQLSSGQVIEEIPLASLPIVYGIDGIKVNSINFVFGTRFNLSRLIFEKDCPTSIDHAPEESPTISYSQAGTYPITLTAIHPNGNRASVTKAITVTDNEAPEGSIDLNEAYCITDAIPFSFTTEDAITDYAWDFGDSNSSTDPSPSHQYTAAGDYSVTLTVTSPEGCSNVFTQAITIFEEAAPDFSTAQAEYCSFESIDFSNLTPGDYGDNISYSWDFNGEGTSSETNPNFSFASSGEKTIRLTANVLGCETYVEKTLNIIDGPQVDFAIGDICLGADIALSNLSEGDNITGYRWELDGEEFSTDENTEISFENAGVYQIRLTVSNAAGCENSIAKEIRVFDQIIADIAITQAIENLPFTSEVQLIADQPYSITAYEWELNGQSSTEAVPTWNLELGTYELSLSLTTDAGCSFSFQKEITVAASQLPFPDFSFEDELCLNERIILANSSINTNLFEWDFCPGDFDYAPQITNNIGTSISLGNSFKLIEHNGNYYGFALNAGLLYRYDFGNNLSNTPTIINLGDLGVLSNAEGLDIAKEGDKWIGFTGFGFGANGGNVFRLVWEDLSLPPVGENLGNFGQAGRVRAIGIASDQTQKALIMVYGNNTLSRVDFGSTLLNSFGSGDIYVSAALTDVSGAIGLSTIKKGSEWYLAIASITNRGLSVFSLGTNLFSAPQYISSTLFPSFGTFAKLKLVEEAGNYYGLLSINNAAMKLLDFKQLALGQVIEEIPLASLQNVYGIDGMKVGSTNYVFGTRTNLSRLIFERDCPTFIDFSTEDSPTISYSQAGTYPITLTAIHPNGNRVSITKEITVTDNEAPGIDFTFSGEVCEGALITLSPQASVPLASYSWDFGDGNVSDQEAPQHSFDSPGTYMVRLRVESEEGCSNFVEKSVTIFPAPVAAIEIVGDLFCTFDPITFQNLTTGDYGELITWEWDFNGEGSSTEREPTYIFESPGEKTITLKAMIPGCEDLVSSQIVLVVGPNVNFEVEDICFGETASFNNLSTGEGITGYFWEFGDGYTSTLENPAHFFESPGEYVVTLRAGNANGCENTFQSTIKVSDLPVAEFSFELACSNAPIQFFDSSAAPNANLQQWLWEVKDMEGNTLDNSSNQNPIFNFSQGGNYLVGLTVFNNFGCEDVMTKTISVIQQPAVEIQKDIACAGFQIRVSLHVPELFVDSLVSITWLWRGQTLMQDDLVFNNLAAGTYPVQAIARFENRCELILTDEVTVPGLPEASFSFQVACPGEAVVFEGNGDNRASGLQTYWKLANDTLGVGNTFAWFPSAPGTYTIEMIVLNEEGCIATQTQTVLVPAGPRASFTISSNTGVSPFLPVITNTSERANQFVWRSGLLNQEDQEVLNPAFRYESPGRYKIELIAIDERGCSDTSSAIIDVIQPVWSMALEGMNIIRTGDLAEINLTLRNTGNVPVQNLEVEISFENATRFQETIRETFTAGTLQNYQLPVRLNLAQNPHISFICVTLKAPAGIPQNRLITPEACETIDPNAWKVADIYPNPATDFAKVDIILQEQSPLRLELVNATGNTLWRQQYPNPRPGLNAYDLDIKNLPSGLYFLIVHHRNETIRKRLVVR